MSIYQTVYDCLSGIQTKCRNFATALFGSESDTRVDLCDVSMFIYKNQTDDLETRATDFYNDIKKHVYADHDNDGINGLPERMTKLFREAVVSNAADAAKNMIPYDEFEPYCDTNADNLNLSVEACKSALRSLHRDSELNCVVPDARYATASSAASPNFDAALVLGTGMMAYYAADRLVKIAKGIGGLCKSLTAGDEVKQERSYRP